MPELPEVLTYLETLTPRLVGQRLEKVRIRSPSLLRTYDPPVSELEGRTVRRLGRIGKRVVWELEGDLFAVFHLMINGRFKWRARGTAVPKKRAHGAFDFPTGTLLLTEASTQKRATLHVVRGEAALADPRILDGIGNAHSDEILHRARLSPTQRTHNLDPREVESLHEAVRSELEEWTARLREEAAGEVPEKVTAFHPAMAVHGKYGEPCPRCGDPIQRIRYASNETNYCATCQTGGKVLADRALSRLLGEDWPRTLEELEERLGR